MPSLPTNKFGNKAYDIGSLAAKQHVSVHSSNGEANLELMRSFVQKGLLNIAAALVE